MNTESGGEIIGARLAAAGATALFTLCGGHISPILVGAAKHGIKIVDTRDEVSAVFAADATARLTGNVGVAAVTAGPGVTNTITAVKNAQMAESPIIIFGGATATILRGRGSLQDIDQLAIMKPITKWATRVTTRGAIGPTVERAIAIAKGGVPGPVFIEVPVDLLYGQEMVKSWYMKEAGVEAPSGIIGHATKFALEAYLFRNFHQPNIAVAQPRVPREPMPLDGATLQKVTELVKGATRPVLVIGSQALAGYNPDQACQLAAAVRHLGIPTFLGGMARGLLGRTDPTVFRHKRSQALRKADVVIIAGFPLRFSSGVWAEDWSEGEGHRCKPRSRGGEEESKAGCWPCGPRG